MERHFTDPPGSKETVKKPETPGTVFAHEQSGLRHNLISDVVQKNRVKTRALLLIGIPFVGLVSLGTPLLLGVISPQQPNTPPPPRIIVDDNVLVPPPQEVVLSHKSITELNNKELAWLILNSQNEPERAAQALKRAQTNRIPYLTEMCALALKGAPAAFVKELLGCLEQLGDRRATPFIIEMIGTANPDERLLGVTTLEHLGDSKAVGFLEYRKSLEQDKQVLAAMDRAIGKLRGYSLQ